MKYEVDLPVLAVSHAQILGRSGNNVDCIRGLRQKAENVCSTVGDLLKRLNMYGYSVRQVDHDLKELGENGLSGCASGVYDHDDSGIEL